MVCYVFLVEIPRRVTPDDLPLIRKCRWFRRGCTWTVQELIAPTTVVFFSSRWKEIGTRDSLSRWIASLTGIDEGLFTHGQLYRYSIAQRMSWAAGRETTRIEDMAYCLLGIFGVNIPLMYGEGRMAFIRLQDQILRRSDDHSIFAWSARCYNDFTSAADSGNQHQQAITLTMNGMELLLMIGIMKAQAMEHVDKQVEHTVAFLNCYNKSGKRVAIPIERASTSESAPFCRVWPDGKPKL
jgi:hypothetical protein